MDQVRSTTFNPCAGPHPGQRAAELDGDRRQGICVSGTATHLVVDMLAALQLPMGGGRWPGGPAYAEISARPALDGARSGTRVTSLKRITFGGQ